MLLYNPSLENPISTASEPIALNTGIPFFIIYYRFSSTIINFYVVDVTATLWQFFSASGASIPAESVGKVYPVTTSAATRYKALKTNAIQLRNYLKYPQVCSLIIALTILYA